MKEELKTLKDLFEDSKTRDNMLFCEDLREEANKWIKTLDQELKTYNMAWKLGQREFIKHFFNLEDEK